MAMAAVAGGCAGPVGIDATLATVVPPTTTTTTAITTTATATVPDTGDLVSPEVREIMINDRAFLVAWVDEPVTRARGLMGVEDLGDLDGMLFDLGEERTASFTMRDTLIPLDIVFFAEDGTGRTMLTMVPCTTEPCPTYPSGEPARYALEIPAGSTDLTAASTLVVP